MSSKKMDIMSQRLFVSIQTGFRMLFEISVIQEGTGLRPRNESLIQVSSVKLDTDRSVLLEFYRSAEWNRRREIRKKLDLVMRLRRRIRT